MAGSGAFMITEKWIRDKLNLQIDNLDTVRSLSLPGSYHCKITHLSRSLMAFTRLKHLDLSRNSLESLEGIDHLLLLETLNVYYNNIPNLKELFRLRHNTKLRDLDLRLNPVTKQAPDYRLFVIHMLLHLNTLDDRRVSDEERKAALMFFDTDQAYDLDKSIHKENAPPNDRSTPVSQNPVENRLALTKSVAPLRRGLGADTDELLELFAERGDHLFLTQSPPTRTITAKRKILQSTTTTTTSKTPQPPITSVGKKIPVEKRTNVTPNKRSPHNNNPPGLNFTPHPHQGNTVAMDTVTMATNNKEGTCQEEEQKLHGDTTNTIKEGTQHKPNSSELQEITTSLKNLTNQQSKIEGTLSKLSDSLSQLLTHSTQLQSVVSMLHESHKSLVASNQHLLKELDEIKVRHTQEVTQLTNNYNTLRALVHDKLHL